MEGKEEDVKLGANKFPERQPLGTSAQTKDYNEPPPAPLFEPGELKSWSFYRAGIAEFMATFLFLYITVLTVMGVGRSTTGKCSTVGIQGIAWAFGGMIFCLVYCTAGISGGHINPAVTFGLLLARKLSLTERAISSASTTSTISSHHHSPPFISPCLELLSSSSLLSSPLVDLESLCLL
uniref:Uncharacterized protein n=1 Tax=Kalanchoe fedtschenkoi TaxID=63787 RepID=A0A7N1A9J3_KALFE